MKRQTYILLSLTVLVLAVFFFLKQPTRMVETSYAPPDWELPIDTSRVERIEVRRADGSFVVSRKHGTWKLEQPGRPNADGPTVTRLLEGIANFKLIGLVSSNPRKADMFGVGELGTTVVVTSDDGKPISVIVGKMSSLPSRGYIRPSTLDMVYLVRGMTPDVFMDETVNGWGKTVIRIDPAAILSISLETGQTVFTIRREGQRWISSEKPVPDYVIAPVLAVLAELRAGDAIESEVDWSRKPWLGIEIREQKGIRMEFYARINNDSGYILRTSLSSKSHFVSRGTAQVFQQLISHLSLPQQTIASAPLVEPLPRPLQVRVPTATPTRVTVPPRREAPVRRAEATPPPKPRLSTPSSTTETSNENGKIEDEGALTIHVVKSGETLGMIARQYNVTEEQVRQWNLLTSDAVSAGTELYVFARK